MTTTIRAAAVLLDMDGTLVDSTAVVERIWGEWAASHGLDPAAVMEVVHGRQSHEIITLLMPHRTDAENRADSLTVLQRETAEVDGVVAIPGALDLMRSLAGSPHAVVTSASAALAHARMAVAGLTLPPVSVTSNDVTRSKPDPEGFLTAARTLGVPALSCVAFEDSAAGIAAARNAGMRVVGVGPAAAVHQADWSVQDLSSVRVHVHVADAGLAITF